jgi:hypothetical protein
MSSLRASRLPRRTRLAPLLVLCSSLVAAALWFGVRRSSSPEPTLRVGPDAIPPSIDGGTRHALRGLPPAMDSRASTRLRNSASALVYVETADTAEPVDDAEVRTIRASGESEVQLSLGGGFFRVDYAPPGGTVTASRSGFVPEVAPLKCASDLDLVCATLRLERAMLVRVLVCDARSGAAISGARADILKTVGESDHWPVVRRVASVVGAGQTDASGLLALPVPSGWIARRSVVVRIERQGWATTFWEFPFSLAQKDESPVRLAIERAGTLSVRVAGDLGGALTGVAVSACPRSFWTNVESDRDHDVLFVPYGGATPDSMAASLSGAVLRVGSHSTTTDGNGEFTFSDLLPGEWVVTLRAAGFVATSTLLTVWPGGTARVQETMKLQRAGTVRVIVRDVTQSGVGRVSVSLEDLATGPNLTVSRQTNENGEVTFDGVAPGEYAVTCGAIADRAIVAEPEARVERSRSAERIVVRAGELVLCELETFSPPRWGTSRFIGGRSGYVAVNGMVSDEAGTPMGGIAVRDPSGEVLARTGPTGAFAIETLGGYDLAFGLPGEYFAVRRVPQTRTDARVEFVLSRRPEVHVPVVVRADELSFSEERAILVTCRSQAVRGARSHRSVIGPPTRSAQFLVTARGDWVEVLVEVKGSLSELRRVDLRSWTGGSIDISLSVAPSIVGLVVDEQMAPLPRASVVALCGDALSGGSLRISTESDERGWFQLSCPRRGAVEVVVSLSGFADETSRVSMSGDSGHARVSAVLRKSGVVRVVPVAGGGAPLAGVSIHASPLRANSGRVEDGNAADVVAAPVGQWGVTNARGVCDLTLATGRWRLSCGSCYGTDGGSESSEFVDVTAGRLVEVKLQLASSQLVK